MKRRRLVVRAETLRLLRLAHVRGGDNAMSIVHQTDVLCPSHDCPTDTGSIACTLVTF